MIQTSNRHVVRLLTQIQPQDHGVLAGKVAERFGIRIERAGQLLHQNPGGLTKPSSHGEAKRIASILLDLGVPVEVVELPDHQRGALTSDPTSSEANALPAPDTDAPPALLPPRQRHRFGLPAKLLATTALPVLIIAIGALAVLHPTVQRGYDQLLSSSAAEIAYTIAFGLDINDPAVSAAEIMLVTHRKDVGFIRVQSRQRDAVQFFAKDPVSKFEGWLSSPKTASATRPDPTGSWIVNLAQTVDALETTRGGQRLHFRDERSTLHQHRLSGTTDPNVARAIQADLEALKPYANRTTSYTVQQANVYRAKNGNRTVLISGESDQAPTSNIGDLAYTLQIGLLDVSARALQREQLYQLLGLTGLTLLVAATVAAMFARRMSQRILALTFAADRISLGELEASVKQSSHDELGDLAAALERMRLSLKISMERLRKRR